MSNLKTDIQSAFQTVVEQKQQLAEIKKRTAQAETEFEKRIYVSFGQVIKKLRVQKEWTQADVADKLGYVGTSITNIEKGKQKVLLEDVFVFALIFEMDILDFMKLLLEYKDE